ncbi:MAG: hypothetical protein LQ344_007055 [Seirophora lacunosa]|nr:MAG: hypothetical protein LQ344_007055 [Seirophora lacunosa]
MIRVISLFPAELHMEKKASPRDTRPDDLVPYFLMRKNTTELLHGLLVKNPMAAFEITAATFKIYKIAHNPMYVTQKRSAVNEGQVDNLKYTPSRSAKGMGRLRRMLEDVKFSGDYEWDCVVGRLQEIAGRSSTKLEEKQRNRVHFGETVTEIDRLYDPCRGGRHLKGRFPQLAREVAGERKSRVYNAAFNSSPLGNMQRMNMGGLNLYWVTKQAIRSLHSSSEAEYQEVREIVEENYDTHSAYDWYADTDTMG